MKFGFVFTFCLFSASIALAQNEFPASWVGHWKGELQWFKAGARLPERVPMQLKIQTADSNTWSWQLIYGADTADNRPYTLMARDSAKGHWVIDEKNGILLDQYWIGHKLSGAFTVQGSTLVNSYTLENEQLTVEFYSMSAKPVRTSGKGNSEIPFVDSYRLASYQKAILYRTP